MRTVIYSSLAALGLAGAWVLADDVRGVKDAQWTLNENPQAALQEFADKLHETNQGEIQMAELAVNKAQDPKLKEFAQQMIREHRTADQKLSEFVRGKNVAFSERQTKFDRLCDIAGEQMKMNMEQKLNSLSGSQFDHCFLGVQFACHSWQKAFLQAASNYLPDQQGRDLAKGMLSTVEEHTQRLEQLAKQMMHGAEK